MLQTLPEKPHIEHLKKQAKALRRYHRLGHSEAVKRIRALFPKYKHYSDAEILRAKFSVIDAQIVIAREYNFPNWAHLKKHIESIRGLTSEQVKQAFKRAVQRDQVEKVKELGRLYKKELSLFIDESMFAYAAPALVFSTLMSKDRIKMVEALLSVGADINAKSAREDGGVTALQASIFLVRDLTGDGGLIDVLLKHGARQDIWTASGLGDLERLESFLKNDPELVNSLGPNGQIPLHFARDEKTIDALLAHGAILDQPCLTYGSTPAQYAIKHPDACRHFIKRGARTDIFMACELNDIDLAKAVIAREPDCTSAITGQGDYADKNAMYGGIYGFI